MIIKIIFLLIIIIIVYKIGMKSIPKSEIDIALEKLRIHRKDKK